MQSGRGGWVSPWVGTRISLSFQSPAPAAPPQECWAKELEAGVGCLAGLLAASCSLPLLLVLVTA